MIWLDRAPGSIWPTLRSPRKAARPLVARIGTVAAAPRSAASLTRAREIWAAGSDGVSHGRQNVEHRLLADTRLASRRDRVDAGGDDFGKQLHGRGALAERLAHAHEQAAVQRAGRSADLHHERHPDGLQGFSGRLGGDRVELGQHFGTSAFHVDPVIAVTDRLIEGGELFGAIDHLLRPLRRSSIGGYRSLGIARALTQPRGGCAAPPHRSRAGRSATSPTSSPAETGRCGSARVTRACPLYSICTWFWSPRCSTRCTRPTRPEPFGLPIARCSVRTPIVSARSGIEAAGMRLAGMQIDARRAQSSRDIEIVRAFVDLARRSKLDQAPLANHADAGRHRHGFDLVMRDVEDGRAKVELDALDLKPQFGAQLGVERGKRLVHQIDGRAADERAADRDALHLAAGQPSGAVAELAGNPEEIGHLLHPLADLRLGQLAQRRAQREGQIVVHRQMRIERILLEDERDIARGWRLARSRPDRQSKSRPGPAAQGPRSGAKSWSCPRRSVRAERRTRRWRSQAKDRARPRPRRTAC